MDSPSVIRTMMDFILITASILCSLSWISVSAAESQTVKVQPGEEVNLLCPNMSKYDGLTFWFRLVNGTKIGCISVKYPANAVVSYCDELQHLYSLSQNQTSGFIGLWAVFLWIYTNGRPTFSVTRLNVKGDNEFDDDMDEKSDETTKLMGVILGGVTVFLFMVTFGLVVKIWKLQKANHEENNPQRSKNLDSEELNYGTVTFGPRGRRREMEPNVVYAATR
ncbi:uncharacterized protein LOC117152769 [Mastacembelus armatus]|uniref:uncharacterized protein LOC117152769 n=1 Tax=Mastacembelus armatus TaxID=205130 RepID=UPI001436C1DF|nr:uncharacterized protein LOC117152769 [Mastacembelus armatus]